MEDMITPPPPALRKLDTKHEEEEIGRSPLLDLPESTLECIVERLPPAELFRMAGVCRFLRSKCASNHLWARQLNRRWGRLMSTSSYRAWQSFIASDNMTKSTTCLPGVSDIMYFYFALETGKFWFPAQVFYCQNWDVSFVMSCYDAELSYSAASDNFQARYPPHGRRAVETENGIEWERLRAPAVETSPYQLSDRSSDLRPGDHIEVQWRTNKVSPYGWWYGVVGHLETCNANETDCQCHTSKTVVLEFKQYAPGSQWRRMTLRRKGNKEEGSRAVGFYGGIRKLYSREEVAVWERIWPADIID